MRVPAGIRSRGVNAEGSLQSDEEQVRQFVATWMAASKAGEVGTVFSLMAEDVVFLAPGRPAMRKGAFAAAARNPPDSAPRIESSSEIQEIQVLGDWAFRWTRLCVAVTAARRRPTRCSRRTHAFHSENRERQVGPGA